MLTIAQRKTRCDPGLPRCGPCERTNSTCEYWDPTKNQNINRDYVVYLQHKVRTLELELEKVETDEGQEDPEAMVRGGASVRLQDADDTRYLGPSSGTQITRLVMQLAKQFTDSKTIKEIVTDTSARRAKATYAAEASKPTSKVYPLTSDVAAEELPNRSLTDLLIQLYNLKVQPMYPALHEPTFAKDVEVVYAGKGDAYQNFVLRMVISISLQKMDTQYAGLADSYYLAALQYLEEVMRPMNLNTLQAFALIAQYSLLTPTRTAIYYVMGLAIRLGQALGINEEKTITRGIGGGKADCLEIDMRRRLFWCTLVMELGLSHALGRPSILATSREHIDVAFFETVSDEYITPEGILPGAPRPTLKKWIAIHFFKMRLLQLEIRRKLYLKKRPQPKDDQDPWFQQMNAKLEAWRDASPNNDEGSGLNKIWFIGRYNTMIVFLFRPSPQVPKPSLGAALKCFEACRFNIYVQREQITMRNVDLTWIFTQSIFMAINTLLWSLSYSEVRKQNPKQDVQKHLATAMSAIEIASDRWPGVASAIQLYENLIEAIMKIYDKEGDVSISESTPSDAASPAVLSDGTMNRSRTTSPATISSSSIATPPERPAPFGYFHQSSGLSVEQPPPVPYQSLASPSPGPTPPAPPPLTTQLSNDSTYTIGPNQPPTTASYDPMSQFNPLPTNFPDLGIPGGWNPAFAQRTSPFGSYHSSPSVQHLLPAQVYPTPLGTVNPYANVEMNYAQDATPDIFNPSYWGHDAEEFGGGIDQAQQTELLQSLETTGMEDIQTMIVGANRIWNPQQTGQGT